MGSSPTEVHLIRGACLVCELEGRMGTPENPPGPGSPAICGGCASLHVLEAELLDGEWVPRLRRPGSAELLELLKRDDLRAIRDAFALDQMESRIRASSAKVKAPSPPRVGGKVRLGPNRLETRGPGA